MKSSGGYKSHSWKVAVTAAVASLLVTATVIAAERAQSVSEILIERLMIRVVSNAKLAYQIEAGEGRMNEDTREIELKGPNVAIYGEDEKVRQSVHSAAGRMWPVQLTVADEKGGEKEVSKYDWSLTGDVSFESVEGYLVKSSELNFSSAERNITSTRGVEYRMPTGRGTILSGKAPQFEARVDPTTGALTGWTLAGGVELSADPENPPDKTEEADASTSAASDAKPAKSDKKKKRTLDERLKEELKEQKGKLDGRKKKKD